MATNREDRIRADLKKAIDAWRVAYQNLCGVLAITAYHYAYWPIKAKIRSRSREIAHTVCSVSLLILFLEIIFELGAVPALKLVVKSIHDYKYWVGGSLTLAVAVLFLHSLFEMRRAHVDQSVADSLWGLHFAKRPHSEVEYVQEILKVTVETFKRYGAFRACIWIRRQGSGKLEIPKEFLYPECAGVLRELDLHFPDKPSGVAAIVLHDGRVRYSPRLQFPWDIKWLRWMTMEFLHSVVYEPVMISAENGKQYMDLEYQELEPNGVVVEGLKAGPDMKAFVSAPITTKKDSRLGVLCIDFCRPDPLTKSDIKAVATIGFSIGAELERYAAKRSNGDPGLPPSYFGDFEGPLPPN